MFPDDPAAPDHDDRPTRRATAIAVGGGEADARWPELS
jgi:hypothetical protein